jgi:MFS family permease
MARKWWTLLLVCVGSFMLLLDVTIVNVALPEIERDLVATLTDLQWVIGAYVLAVASLTLIAGSLGDRLGLRRAFTRVLFGAHFPADVLAGIALGYASAFVAHSFLAATSPEPAYERTAQSTRSESRTGRNELASPS